MRNKGYVSALLFIGIAAFGVTAGNGIRYVLQDNSADAQLARANGFDVHEYKSVKGAEIKARDRRTLSPDEFHEVQTLAESSTPAIRVRALTSLYFLGDSPLRQQAITLAKSKIKDPNGPVRQYALSALSRLKDPDAKTLALAMKNDPHEGVRAKAAIILAKS